MKLATSRLKEIIREEIAAVAAADLNEGLPMPRDVGLGAGPTGLTGLGLSRVDHQRFRDSRFGVAKFTGHEKPKTYNREKRTHDILAAVDEDGALWFKVARGPGDLDEPEAELKKLGYRYSPDVPVPS